MVWHTEWIVETRGRGLIDLGDQVRVRLADCPLKNGIAQLFCRHTSASLLFCENADPDVRRDLETWFSRQVVDGDPAFCHTMEGPDDMSAHIRSILTANDLGFPLENGRPVLGTWQGIYLWEHRARPHRRSLRLTVVGE